METGVKVLGHELDPLADDGEFVDGHGEKIWKYRQYIGKKAQAVTRPGEYWALLGQLVVSTKRQGPKGGSGEPKKGAPMLSNMKDEDLGAKHGKGRTLFCYHFRGGRSIFETEDSECNFKYNG